MNTALEITIYRYIDLLIKWRWMVIIPFCLSMIAGTAAILFLPKVYESDTLIIVESKKIPDAYLKNIGEDIQKRVSLITELVKSRSYATEVINKTGVYSGPKYDKMVEYEKIELLQKNISVKPKRAAKGGGMDSFTLSFSGDDPKKAQKVVEMLSSFFIDESVRVMEGQANDIVEFLERQLEVIKGNLEKDEEKMRQFRESHKGSLPDELDSNLRNLDRLQANLNEKQQGLRDAKARLIQIENVVSEYQRQRNISEGAGAVQSSGADVPIASSESPELSSLKTKYAALLNRYTEQHPDVIVLKKTIEDMENAPASIDKKPVQMSGQKPSGTDSKAIAAGYSLKMQLEDTRREIQIYEEDIASLRKKIQEYEQQVANTPKTETELLALSRNYNNLKKSYYALADKVQEARMSAAMENQNKGMKFRIVDKAKLPQKPSSPNLTLIFALSVAAGLGVGGGILFLLDWMDGSIRMPEEAESLFKNKSAPIITIPKLLNRRQMMWNRINWVFTVLFIGISLVLFAGFGFLSTIGGSYTPQIVQSIKNFL